MAAKNVNIYSPGWIFFLIFFLVFNIYVLVHHTYHNNVRKSFKPQGRVKGEPTPSETPYTNVKAYGASGQQVIENKENVETNLLADQTGL